MLDRLIKLLSLLSTVFTLVFFVMLYAMLQGFDPGPLLRGEAGIVERNAPATPDSIVPKKAETPTSTIRKATTSSLVRPVATTTTKTASPKKPSAPVVKKPVRSTPIVSTPAPLLVEKSTSQSSSSPVVASSSDSGNPSSSGALNQKTIFDIVNQERAKASLLPLTFNVRLSAMAEGKAVDMINKQYFAHVSPNGTDVAMLSKVYGYEYIFLGENLAMGDFVSSAEVMEGWMNSPGHRANILNKNYTEIGISALQGNYQGRVVWYAVQEFGRPLSSCPSPDNTLQTKIAGEEAQISATEQTLATLRATIERSSASQSTYNALVEEYNTRVDQYNILVAATKSDISDYNAGVSAFNACIGVNKTSTSTPTTE